MKIGIVATSRICIPLLSNLINYKKGEVILYWANSPMPDVSIAELTAFCNANRIAIHFADKKEELYQWQQLHNPDIIFIDGYSHKINIDLLTGVSKGVYNIHFGKLPEFRGPSPVFWQLKKGVPELTITIHELSDKLDGGTIVWEHSIKTESFHTYNFVYYIFSHLQVNGVFEVIGTIEGNIPLKNKIQDESKANYYPKPQLADIIIYWDLMEAKEIVDLINACNSWNIGPSSLINGIEVKLMDAIAFEGNSAANDPGTIIVNNDGFFVNCINSSLLAINFFNINQTFIPARFAAAYGLQTGQKFVNSL